MRHGILIRLQRTDYAAPEVLQGKAYGGKEQDVWALGILLYTIVYKENPFYNIGMCISFLSSQGASSLCSRSVYKGICTRLQLSLFCDKCWAAEAEANTFFVNHTDEILDHPLRVPYLPFSEGCIDLIRRMLDRDVDQRVDIQGVKGHYWLVGSGGGAGGGEEADASE